MGTSSMKRPSIAIVAHDVHWNGGMERHIAEMLMRMQDEYEVYVVAGSFDINCNQHVHFIQIPIVKKPFPLKYFMFLVLASIRLLSLRVDLIHTTGAIVLNRADVSTVHFCHYGYMKEVGNERVRNAHSILKKVNSQISTIMSLLMEKYIYRSAKTANIVAVSARVRKEVLNSFPYNNTQVHIIENGVDGKKFSPLSKEQRRLLRKRNSISSDGCYILFMGGDWPLKGLREVLIAFNKIGMEIKNIHLLIVGKGSTDVYQKLVIPELCERVHFVGVQTNPQDWLALSDIFILPSSYETFSLVVHEAASCGLAILATRVGGVEDLIEDGVSGFFISRDVNSIVDRLRLVATNQEIRDRLGTEARKKVRELTWDNSYQKMKQLYDGVLGIEPRITEQLVGQEG